MALEKEWDFSSSISLPATIRNLVSQTLSFHPLKKLGTGYYQHCSQKIAKSFQNNYPKCKIFLSGSEEAYRSPGAFDLDFLLVREKEIKEKELWDLRTDFFEMRRKFPMFGEIFYTHNKALKTLEASDSASSVWFSDRKRFSDDKWKVAKKSEAFPTLAPSRVALGVYHFRQAQRYLVQSSLGSSSLNLAKFYKEIGKALWICSGQSLGSLDLQNPAILMAHAFYQIQKLAESALEQKSGSLLSLDLDFPEKNGPRFLAETLNRSWIVKLKKMNGSLASLRATSCPLVLTPLSSLNLVSSLNLFAPFIQGLNSLTQETREIPLIVPQSAWELMVLGWHWDSPLVHLDWVYPGQTDDLKWKTYCGNATLSRLRERVLLDWNLIPGKMITSSPENIHQSLKKFFWSLLTLKAGENLPDFDLIEKNKAQLSRVSRAYRLLTQDKPMMNLQSLVKMIVESSEEVSELVTSFSSH